MNKAQTKPLGHLSMENRQWAELLCKVRAPSLHVLFASLPGLALSAGRREGPDQSPACRVTDSLWDRMGCVRGPPFRGREEAARVPGSQAMDLVLLSCGCGRGWPWALPCPARGAGACAASPWQQHTEPGFHPVLLGAASQGSAGGQGQQLLREESAGTSPAPAQPGPALPPPPGAEGRRVPLS